MNLYLPALGAKVIIAFTLMSIIGVIIHEYAHFVYAKLFKFRITEFSIGTGPIIFFKRHNHVRFVARFWMFIGGHIRIHKDELADEKAGLWYDTKYVKFAIVAFAGAAANALVAIASFFAAKHFHSPYLLLFSVVNAINLMNLLPLPGFDGGQILACGIKFTQRKVKRLIRWISSML